jgi:hypothetical protein
MAKYYFVRCDVRSLLTFRRNVLPPSSGPNCTPNKQTSRHEAAIKPCIKNDESKETRITDTCPFEQLTTVTSLFRIFAHHFHCFVLYSTLHYHIITNKKGHYFSRSEGIKSCGHWMHANICCGSKTSKTFRWPWELFSSTCIFQGCTGIYRAVPSVKQRQN